MKQNFDEKSFLDFKKEFSIKEDFSEIEKIYLEKTYKYISFIKWLPWLKMIGIWNSLAMKSAKKSSDIDLFIVTSKNSLWFVRIMTTLFFQIFWVRKTAKNHAWRFCLSFFSTLDWMNFKNFKIENDIYLFYRIVYFKPILDFDETYKFFLEQNSSWADFSNYFDILEENKKFIKFRKNTTNKKENFFIIFLDKLFKKIFLAKTLRHFEKIWKPFWVIIDDNLLKFHNEDLRKEISKKLIKKD